MKVDAKDFRQRIERLKRNLRLLDDGPGAGADNSTAVARLDHIESQLQEVKRRLEAPLRPTTQGGEARPAKTAGLIDSACAALRQIERREAEIALLSKQIAGSDAISASDLKRLGQLAALARSALENAAASSAAQRRILPSLEALDATLESDLARCREISTRIDAERRCCCRLEALMQELLAGGRPASKEIQSIANWVIDRQAADAAPLLLDGAAAPMASSVAIHGINTALMVARLVQGDPKWRLMQPGLVSVALFHDVGMLKDCDEIGSHSGRLDLGMQEKLERHPLTAEVLIEQLPDLEPEMAKAAGLHHERLDGSGYPRRLRAESLNTPARLLAIADAYAALRSRRAHRPPYAARQAMTSVLGEAEAGRLDSAWASRLLDLSLYPPGTFVELSTGEIAEVVASQEAVSRPGLAALPIVRICRDAGGRPIALPKYRNLALRSDCRVVRELTAEETLHCRAA